MIDFMKIDINELKKNLIGKRVRIRSDLRCGQDSYVGVTIEMEELAGRIVTITELYKDSCGRYIWFKTKEIYCSWELTMIDAIIKDENINEDEEEKQEEVEFEIKKGDLVKFKEIGGIEDGTVVGKMYGLPLIYKRPAKIQEERTKKEFIVADIIDDNIMPYYINESYKNAVIKKKSVELIEEGYVSKLKKKKKPTEKDKKILEDLDIIEEMKSKVNIKDFKKIYAGSLTKKPTDLKGVELLIHQWACNKKHIYKMLGNQLSISKEIEYTRVAEDMRSEREKIYREFPGSYYVIESIKNEELAENKLKHSFKDNWCDYGPTNKYEEGTKVSKILNDAFKNDKLNTLYSDIVAQSKIKGNIEISIDPIEILLMSCNASGWDSCHRINKLGKNMSWGSYSGGIFSYMCDDVSMIAFRHDGKKYDYKIYNSTTQQKSKNWRQMIYIDKEFNYFVTSRQYPCKMDEIRKQIGLLLEDQINKDKTWVHSEDMNKIKNIIKDYKYDNRAEHILHYNDMLCGYSGHLYYDKEIEQGKMNIKVGSNPVCPVCGSRLILKNDYPMCKQCRENL